MKRLISLSAAFVVLCSSAQAACFADYKAKRDDPLRLHYGVAEVRGDCTPAAARNELTTRLAAADWQLLSIEGVFDDAGLEERESSAGEFYLRY